MANVDARAHTDAASWLNQVEIYFSIVQRKVVTPNDVTPNDFASLGELEDRLLAFQGRYEQTAKPFQWAFTQEELADLLAKLKAKELAAPPDRRIRHRNYETQH